MASLGRLAALVGGEVIGNGELEIKGVSGIEDPRPGTITLVGGAKVLAMAEKSAATAFIFPENLPLPPGLAGIKVDNPRLAFAKILRFFHPPQAFPAGIHSSAVVEEGFKHGEGCYIGPLVFIGKNVTIGDRVIIHPGAVIEEESEIGDDTEIHANAVIKGSTLLGKRVIIHAGAVIGSDGFGYVPDQGRHFKIPQTGRVIIEDDVEIGANVTVDRATTGATLIKRGTKIDNLVQVGHNVEIGQDNLVVAQTGIAGSARLEDRVTLAGQAGIKDHVTVGADTVIAARGMVIGDVPPGAFYSGQPARSHPKEMRIQAAAGRLPELIKKVKDLEKRLAELEHTGSACRQANSPEKED
ncbi:MAG TPA: UDP-3-O-(3-hydroxymyristoyl)glucosamine N-acyltransferase [Firmicutes bacterium]|nr:UDP-3-O-(3-hydroxymyristoyl)glucosamine N-acyltransferase [Bacillota bacterium]